MAHSYWSKTIDQRISRRRALAVTGSGALGAAFLAACGGSSDSGGPKTEEEVSSLVTRPADTTKQAKRGGALKFSVASDIPNFDPHFLSLANAAQVLLNYNRMTRIKPGVLELQDGSVHGDAAESWEFSPDKATLTFKVRPNLGTPPVAPVNGRNLDAEDIVYSWERFKRNGNNRSDYANDVNPNAPIVSLTAPDSKTIVVKLNKPVSTILSLFSSQGSGQFFVFPKEAESGLDLRRTPMGAGVYYLSEYVPSSRFVYKRNPNFFDKNVGFAETIEVPIVSENATGIAQLKAGGLYNYNLLADQVLQVKNDVSDIGMYQTDLTDLGIMAFFGFKAQPADKTPFRDIRVRQAYAYSLDRELLVDTFGNVSKFEGQGVPVDTAISTSIRAGVPYKGWWLDPKGKEFGANGQYFTRNLEEAKKLLSAAGHANGLNVTANQIGTADYGPNYARYIEVLEGFAGEAGFKFTKAIQGYTTNWPTEFRDGKGFFEGIAYRLTPSASDPGDQMYAEYNKAGSIYYGFDPDGKGLTSREGPYVGDPTADDLTNKMKTEFDDAKRKGYAQDLQRYLAKQQYLTTYQGAASGFNLAWPAVQNWRVLRTQDWGQLWASYWLDETMAPIKKA